MRLFGANCEWSLTTEELRQLFETCGTVDKAVIITNKGTRRSRGIGFVSMPNEAGVKLGRSDAVERPGWVRCRAMAVDFGRNRNSGRDSCDSTQSRHSGKWQFS